MIKSLQPAIHFVTKSQNMRYYQNKPMHILIINFRLEVHSEIVTEMHKQNLTVSTAQDGPQGYIQATYTRPSRIVIDISNNKNDISVAYLLKTSSITKGIPITYLIGSIDEHQLNHIVSGEDNYMFIHDDSSLIVAEILGAASIRKM